MKYSLLIILSFVSNILVAHNIDESTTIPRQWTLAKDNKTFEGYFYLYKNGIVYIEDEHNNIINYPIAAFCKEDQVYTLKKEEWIANINHHITATNEEKKQQKNNGFTLLLIVGGIVFLGLCVQSIATKKYLPYTISALSVVCIVSLFGFSVKSIKALSSVTSTSFLDSAFTPFKPKVYTRWDANYFYVESKGIPNHTMMAGITNWQQQVPIPQCYTGSNAWSIPLNPVIAATPVPVNSSHFLRGAVAIAANGVAIFNPYTNTGADAFLDGQLDTYGGHCGRADDYHYHIAPLALYTLGQTNLTLPCAFALDGFAVYGSKEPDGSNMTTLDANHGHYGSNGVYHYHGTAAAPYMIGNMVGQVTEDATLQIIPQAAASPIRPAQTPLAGATITACVANATNNGYNLTYTKSSQNYNVNYSWTNTGAYTFNFVAPSGTTTTSTYNGFSQCTILVPLKLINFTATRNNATIQLNWATANEINTQYFEVEKSSNAITFKNIATVNAKNIAGINSYFLNDENKQTNAVYYRLKCIDMDGKYTYSAVRKIDFSGENSGINIYPNPAKEYVNIELDKTVVIKDIIEMRVYSSIGSKVFQSSAYQQKINTTTWAKGVYTLTIRTLQQNITKQIIVE